jgi:hypothetical protein
LPNPGIVNKEEFFIGFVDGDACDGRARTVPAVIVDANIASRHESAGHLQAVRVYHAVTQLASTLDGSGGIFIRRRPRKAKNSKQHD